MYKIEKSVLFTIVCYRYIAYYITVTPYIQTREKYFTESGDPKKSKQLIDTRFLHCENCYVKVVVITDLAKFSG